MIATVATVSLALLLTVFPYAELDAQATAQISGTVRDETGLVLTGVEVTVTQTATGITRTGITNETGGYVIPNLPVGPYRLEASLPKFRTYVQTGITLQVGSNPAIDAVLRLGAIAELVEVQADALMVETRGTGVGQVMDNARVLALPLAGRQVTELITLSAPANQGSQLFRGTNLSGAYLGYPAPGLSVAGGGDNALSWRLDGGSHNDPYGHLNAPLPFPDALQEFKVETSALSAQYGQLPAGAVNAVTKS
ncbi:MAG: carboxypeptidase regulatory-like domain-containing protein, partial [Chloroflexi bacterium]|nr:carboxypeptidase regulatory-like domain-containing protein [Chloroflexota bacterium]